MHLTKPTQITPLVQIIIACDLLVMKIFCIPEGVTFSQLQKIYIKYANDNPQDLHLAAGSVVLIAISEAFPCE